MAQRLPFPASLAAGVLALLLSAGSSAPHAHAQPARTPKDKPKETPLLERLRSPYEADRPLTEKLRSPRETLRTLYYAVLLYDVFPEMIDDAIACLDVESLRPHPGRDDAAKMALALENVLDSLALPLSAVPNEPAGESVVLYESGTTALALHRCPDDGWRFDARTLGQLPALRLAAAERRKQRTVPPTLREGFTDPRATMRQFLSDFVNGDFYAAARALDLSSLSAEERRQKGPVLAQQLAFVLQRRGYVFRQEIPDRPDEPAYTWHADRDGRIALDRVRQPDGKDAWQFTRLTVRNVPRMYAAAQALDPDPRYVRLGLVVPGLQEAGGGRPRKRPDDVPAHLGSPRALLQGFFRTMDAANANDARLGDALEYLDLNSIPLNERGQVGPKLASKLEAVLRKVSIDLGTVPDDWNAPPQVLGESDGARVDILRQRDGRWCFSAATVARIPEMFDKLAGKARPEHGRGSNLDSPRDLLITFQEAAGRRDFALAARGLDLGEVHASARGVLGPVLALKLKYVLDRIGRIYAQEVPDRPDSARYVLYRGELGRIALDRRANDPDKGLWQFTPETVQQIEPMFLAVSGRPVDESQQDNNQVLMAPGLWDAPGVWLRLKLPAWAQARAGALALYQWPGVCLAALAGWLGARLTLLAVSAVAAWQLRRSGSALSVSFVASALRPLMWLAAAWAFFLLLGGLDLPVAAAGTAFAAEKFLLAALAGWLGLRLIDLSMGIYTNTESLRPHRNLGDLIVPVSVRVGKAAVVLVVLTYVVYQIGEADLLGRFVTGLGVAGLAASLAAQDAMKSFFGTLLLIGERAFKIGDRILVGGTEGVVEQVGFRSTRLRTAEDSVLTIPNAIIAAAPIDNMGARSNRRFSATIVIGPDAPPRKLVAFRDGLRAWLDTRPLVVRDKVDVHIHRIINDGIELSVSLFLATSNAEEETSFREEITCEVLRQAGVAGLSVAPGGRKPQPAGTAEGPSGKQVRAA
jgi:MscS family membrane protein